MRPLLRRKLDVALTVVAALVVGVAAVIGSLFGDAERVASMWVDAELAADGTLVVSEVIDYDFGPQQRRGIFRDVDDLDPDAAVQVFSPTAPDFFVVFDEGFGDRVRSRIRIGDPSVTISGRHRYAIAFPLDELATGDELGWDAVGTEWQVSIEQSHIRLRSARELLGVECVEGDAGSWNPCDDLTVSPGVVVVEVGRLSPGQGVSLFARLGEPVASGLEPAQAFLPTGAADDPGLGTFDIGIVAALAAIVGAVPMARVIRRLGRERVHVGGPVAAAFGGDDGTGLVDHSDLAAMATTSFAPPDGVSAAQGAVVHLEAVTARAQQAWLLERAIDGEIEIEGEDDDDIVIRRGQTPPSAAHAGPLDKMFGSRSSIDLSKYDRRFTSGWKALERDLQAWQRGSDYWDHRGRVMQVRVRSISAIVGIAGAVLTAAGGAAAARWGGPWVVAVVAGALLAGGAAASMLRSWELLVRSPEGSAAWIQIESFRRFLDGSEASHVENAAAMGRLREYTAWAVALGETRSWTRAIDRAVETSPELANRLAGDLLLVHTARHIGAATSRGSTAPSSRGGGGGFSGGGVGGGGGGGGGGSW